MVVFLAVDGDNHGDFYGDFTRMMMPGNGRIVGFNMVNMSEGRGDF